LIAAGLVAGVVFGAGPAGAPTWAGSANPPTWAGSAKAPGWAAGGLARTTGPPPAAAGTARGEPVAATLLTGDRVTLTSAGAAGVRPAKGREHIRFLVSREGGDLYVIPQDAQRLVRSGKVDRRLFNVTGLVRNGYHDRVRDHLPLIVSYGPAAARHDGATLRRPGVRVTRELPAIGGAAVAAVKDEAAALWAAVAGTPDRGNPGSARTGLSGGLDRIWLDGKRRSTLDQSVAQIGAPAAHQKGYTGRGVTVAVLDTGIDAGHPDLAGKVAEAENFSAAPEPGDTVGHGTHVASIIAGSGAASGGKYRGVAPDATLLSGKVCESIFCAESAILAGLHWAAVDKRATVVNLSIGGPDGPELDPLEQAVNRLTAQTGTLFVVAAGNAGSDGSVGSPGSADAALTVGAVDRSDQLADFSSRGPRIGDDAVKPDLTAPGVGIVAARANGTELGDPVGDRYVAASGTSMATPHVVGSVALLAQQHPDWMAGDFKATLMAAAKPQRALSAYQQGAGRLDVGRAITQAVTTDPVSLSYGRARWPHTDDKPVSRTVTYRNPGPTALPLRLTVRVAGPAGAAPPAGMFRLSANRVTVPAGGHAQVTVTADTRVRSRDGYYSGQLLATGGPAISAVSGRSGAEPAVKRPESIATVVTPLAVHKEVESYDLTLAHVDQTGAAAADYLSFVVGLDAPRQEMPYEADGTVTVRLPKGRYGLTSWLNNPRGDRRDVATLVQPELALLRDTTVALDAGRTRPISMTVPDETAVPVFVEVAHRFVTSYGGAGFGLLADEFAAVRTANLGGAVPASQFVSAVASQWARPDGTGRFDGSPYLYAVSEATPGRMSTGLVRHYGDRDLATVRHEFRGTAPGGSAERLVFPVHPYELGGVALVLPTGVPGERVERYSTNHVRWASELDFGNPDEGGWLQRQAVLQSTPTAYRPGREYREVWNGAPYGLSFPAPGWPGDGITRQGDTVRVTVPVFSDGAGHPGGSLTDTARTALYRGGVLVGENGDPGWGEFPVPPGRAGYRLETEATRSVSDLATKVSAAWTFRSGHVHGDGHAKLPAMVVGFAPELDVTNAAPAGAEFDIPVTVTCQPGATAGNPKALTVEVSYDDGRSWQAAPVRPGSGGWLATVQHPSGAGYASLRAQAVDPAGNTVTQSVIRAYRLR
jgi:subtilisin family serine protease